MGNMIVIAMVVVLIAFAVIVNVKDSERFQDFKRRKRVAKVVGIGTNRTVLKRKRGEE